MVESQVRRGPYGRRRADALGGVPSDAPPPTYYGLPAVKHSHYGWLIASYFFVGGLAGAAQLIAQIADVAGSRRDYQVVRWGRYLALIGALISPALLIKDLHTSSRWYNMLRIFRATSPMSIGSWTLAVFGTCSGLTAAAQMLADLTQGAAGRGLARRFGLPAALLGMLMSVYTGVLLSATSTPLWSVVNRRLPPLFGATATASASAALSLILSATGAPNASLRRLDRLALVCSATQLALNLSIERDWDRLGMSSARTRVLALASTIGPLLLHVVSLITGRRSPGLTCIAAVATLAGAFGERAEIVFEGNGSSDRPQDYFRITSHGQP